ncbi:MAG: hypothetical protein ACK4QW_09985 [Alphaproteobacteria bacterium]
MHADDAARREATRARARAILDRAPPVETAEEIAARRARAAAAPRTYGLDDLPDLERRWATGGALSDDEFEALVRLRALAAHEARTAPARPAASATNVKKLAKAVAAEVLRQTRQADKNRVQYHSRDLGVSPHRREGK